MLEFPETINIAGQISEYVQGKRITHVLPPTKPHKFCWFAGDPVDYDIALSGAIVQSAESLGIYVDILLAARIHPKRKIGELSRMEQDKLLSSIVSILKSMTHEGGRNTEKNIFGKPGGYQTKLSKITLSSGCVQCGGAIIKENYLGGTIYYCPVCQKLPEK